MEGLQGRIIRKIWFYLRTVPDDWRVLLILGLIFLAIYAAVCCLINRTFVSPPTGCWHEASYFYLHEAHLITGG
jgi:hypothetical protein